MKRFLIFNAFLLTITFSLLGQNLNKLKESEKDAQKIQIAEEFTIAFFKKLSADEYYEFDNNATDAVASQLTETVQKMLYQQLSSQFGSFQSVNYAESWVQKGLDDAHIIRLKGKFSDSMKLLEIRIVIDSKQLIAGFWIKPWSDILQ